MRVAAAVFLSMIGLTWAEQFTSCSSNINCSLNGVCTNGVCLCDKPWGGPGCGVLQYRTDQPVSAKSLYNLNNTDPRNQLQPCVSPNYTCDALNTWNGPIVDTTGIDGKFHMFNPLYRKGSLLTTTVMMYGTADKIEGPYEWKSMGTNMGSNPAFVTYNDSSTGKTQYALFSHGKIYLADTVAGPYTEINGSGPGSNPAPLYHNGRWYATSQRTNEVVTAAKLGDPWTHFADIKPRLAAGTQEDPFMYIDKRGNWHIINHAYNVAEYKNCGTSTLSAHVFSEDGMTWQMLEPNVEPYTHTVHYEDGTSHTYTTLERPNCHFNSAGQMTHINLAADLMTQDGGCPSYESCPARRSSICACTNCKYADHAGTIIIALDLD